jgi:hypothetical protein
MSQPGVTYLLPSQCSCARPRARTSAVFRFALVIAIGIGAPTIAAADEGGVSFWLPGLFGSLAAAPQQPGWSLTTIYWHDDVSAGADVSRAREITIGKIPVTANVNLSASLSATVDLTLIVPTYVFANPVLGGQLAVGLMGIYGHQSTSLAGTLSGTLGTPLGTIPFSRTDSISDSVTGFGDLYPQVFLRWNAGVNNYMTYITGDIPVGAYDPTRLSNIGIGHGAVDGGVGYTYFDPKTGHEFSGVLGFTYNTINPDTQYQNGVDMHFDWGASQFLTKQLQVGVVGYVYDEIGCDSGSGDRVGCFQSRVVGVGPQIGYIIPLGAIQAYLNVKGYKEFDAENRPHGWNAWLTVQLAPAPAGPAPPPSRTRSMYTK